MRAKALRHERAAVAFHDFHPKQEDIRTEVLAGLLAKPKHLAPKYFYDERGSELFARICGLEEYYLTRAEMGLLKEKAGEIGEWFRRGCVIIEYGCGSSEKIHLLLEAVAACKGYVAVDIAKRPLLRLTEGLAELRPHLEVVAICADFMAPFPLPLNGLDTLQKIAFFPGSSIGNFDPEQAKSFLRNVAREVGCGGGLLIGVDLKKDSNLLYAAYNDALGVTAEFNKNLLARLNRECAADFDLSRFEHRAFYNAEAGRIEMHLVSKASQSVRLGGVTIDFAPGETIHTENSYKYHVDEFQALARESGWAPLCCWTDRGERMSLHYLEAL